MFQSKIIQAVVASIVAFGAATAFAANGSLHDDERQEAAAVQNAKVTLAQAIAAAERHTGGKAIDSGIENHDGQVMGYDVQVIKGDVVQKVLVDLDTGKVLKVMAATSGDGEDREHERD